MNQGSLCIEMNQVMGMCMAGEEFSDHRVMKSVKQKWWDHGMGLYQL